MLVNNVNVIEKTPTFAFKQLGKANSNFVLLNIKKKCSIRN